jgi:hemolysin activation/secretion protein
MQHAHRITRLTVLALAACSVIGSAQAQATGPGQLEREFATPPSPRPGEGPTIPQTPGQQAPADADKVRFTLKQVEITGNTVFPAPELAATYASMLGREVSLADVFRLADDLTLKYRNEGYVLSRVIVPPQSIRDGVVQLRVVEGTIAQARIEGDTAGPRGTLERHLEAIRNSRPLAASVLERELLLMNDLPGLTARGAVGASATPQASDLTVEIAERRTLFSAGLNNRGSRSLGPWRLDGSAEVRQLLGFDRLSARVVRTVPDNEMTFGTLAYEHALGASGARAGLSLSAVEAEPGGNQNFNLPTSSRSATLHASYPWIRSRARNLSVRASLSVLRSETDIVVAGIGQRFSDDRISAARVGLSFDGVDSFRGVSLVDLELSRGLEALGASRAGDPELSVTGGRPQFTKLTLYAARLQSIAPKWALLAALHAQHSANTLLSPERFAFGGEQFGRAYDSAELTGDSGAAFKGELRFSDSTTGWLRDYTVYGFYEIGTVHRRGTSIALTGQKARESAADAGLGVRFTARRVLTGYVELAQPLTRRVAQEGDKDTRLFVGVQATF